MLDLASLFEITVDPLELVLRGTVMYWFLFLLLRFVLRRDIGSIGIADVLLLVVIADAAQNAMAGGYESITDGIILVATIAGWNWALDRVAYHVPAVRRMLEAQPLPLVRDGKTVAAIEIWKKPGRPAVHPAEAEYAIVLEGSGTLVSGGTLADARTSNASLVEGSRIVDGKTRKLGPGDVILIPAGVPHWFGITGERLILLGVKLPLAK